MSFQEEKQASLEGPLCGGRWTRAVEDHWKPPLHANTIEGFGSIVKRGIVGMFHKVGKKYLHLYVNEFESRYFQRLNADIFSAAIKAC